MWFCSSLGEVVACFFGKLKCANFVEATWKLQRKIHCNARFTATQDSLQRKIHCNARFTATQDLAHLTFTQRSIRAVLPIKADISKLGKPVQGKPQTIGELLVGRRKEAGFTQKQLALAGQIRRKWLGRWERDRALPSQEDSSRLAQILKLPDSANLLAKTPY